MLRFIKCALVSESPRGQSVSDDRAADTYSEHSLRVSSAIGKSSKIAKLVSWVLTVEGRPTRPLKGTAPSDSENLGPPPP